MGSQWQKNWKNTWKSSKIILSPSFSLLPHLFFIQQGFGELLLFMQSQGSAGCWVWVPCGWLLPIGFQMFNHMFNHEFHVIHKNASYHLLRSPKKNPFFFLVETPKNHTFASLKLIHLSGPDVKDLSTTFMVFFKAVYLKTIPKEERLTKINAQ